MTATSHWVHDLDPYLIWFGGELGIRYYGLAYLLGFVIAYGLLTYLRKRGLAAITADQQSRLMTMLVVGVLLGGRLGYILLYTWGEFIRNPLMVFEVWRGGMSSHGGFIGVTLALLLFARRERLSLLHLADLTAVMTPPGILLGRIANFINGELWGIPSRVPWAVIFPFSAPAGTPLQAIAPRHPSQLYEAGLEGLLLSVFMIWRITRTTVARKPGRLAGEFLLLYTLARVVGEQFREPDATLILGLSRGVFYSIFLASGGLLLLLVSRRDKPASGKFTSHCDGRK